MPPKRGMMMTLAMVAVMTVTGIGGCVVEDTGSGEHGSRGEEVHNGQTKESGGEESGHRLTLHETYDTIRNGARLVLDYNESENVFVGVVENTTDGVLSQVRVEVHLSNGMELGPTLPADLAPGQSITVRLPATAEEFDGWTPHAEVGRSEHGSEGGGGEDGVAGSSENGGEHSGDKESGRG